MIVVFLSGIKVVLRRGFDVATDGYANKRGSDMQIKPRNKRSSKTKQNKHRMSTIIPIQKFAPLVIQMVSILWIKSESR